MDAEQSFNNILFTENVIYYNNNLRVYINCHTYHR